MKTVTAYLPFNGGSVYGLGSIIKSDKKSFKYRFTSERGDVYFNSVSDRQAKDLQLISELSDEILKNNIELDERNE